MKRRGFFSLIGKVTAALAPLPLVARDMADFDFLDSPGFPPPPPVPKEVVQKIPYVQEPPISYEGHFRYNTTVKELELYDGKGWVTIMYRGKPNGTGGEAVYDVDHDRTVHTFKQSGTFKL